MRHYNIPIFIPELACPHRCIFCRQDAVSGTSYVPQPHEVAAIVEQLLASMEPDSRREIAFFGGSFTGLPMELQEAYLLAVQPYLADGRIHGIRLSTRPDYISPSILSMLERHGVCAVELGVQSMDERVLLASGRGHTAQQVRDAAALFQQAKIGMGMQMICGLPGDTLDKTLNTAREIVEMGAKTVRIYPALVIEGTALATMYRNGSYQPLELDEAVEWSCHAAGIFERAGVQIIKLGLHPSKEYETGALLAGPYHPSFRQLVLSRQWRKRLAALDLPVGKRLRLGVAPSQLPFAVGYGSCNIEWLKSLGVNVLIYGSPDCGDADVKIGEGRKPRLEIAERVG